MVVAIHATPNRCLRTLSWSLSWLIPLVAGFFLALLNTAIEPTESNPGAEGSSEEITNPASPSFFRVRFNCFAISSSLDGSDPELDQEAHRFREGALAFGFLGVGGFGGLGARGLLGLWPLGEPPSTLDLHLWLPVLS